MFHFDKMHITKFTILIISSVQFSSVTCIHIVVQPIAHYYAKLKLYPLNGKSPFPSPWQPSFYCYYEFYYS